MEAINLDLLPGAMPPIVHVSQGDVGRQFKIAIYDDTGAAYSLTGKTLSIVGHKGDGNVFQYAIPSSAISGNEVTITTEEQMTPAAGKALCEICIEEGTTKLGTANFVMQVEQGPADMGLLSTSALYIIQALFNEATADVEASQAAAATATQKATEAAASAASAAESLADIGDAVDVATAKATDAANSASAAAISETNASSSASTASTAATNASNSATSADTSATAAATSASAASTSASNAATYANAADTSADAASDFADAASQSASAASTSANTASIAASNAASSESAAATSENNAATSASTASTAASNAAASASSAATDASTASTAATNASASANAAAQSASDAETSKEAIEDMTVSAESVAYTVPASVEKTIVEDVVNLNFKIPRGQPTAGHDVEANPTGTPVADITTLGIDGTVYRMVPSGNLAPVATSGSYNDLIDKPTIPDAQVNSDWNATSGKAEILNKPNLSAVATSGNYSDLNNKPNLAAVATSGSYNDLSDKPSIPAEQVNSDWNAASGKAQILNKPNLASVATSGSYNDLSDKPTIPTVNDTLITITQGGVTKGSFTLNQAAAQTIELDAGGSGGSNLKIFGGWNITWNTSGSLINNRQPCYVRGTSAVSSLLQYWANYDTGYNRIIETIAANGTKLDITQNTFVIYIVDSDNKQIYCIPLAAKNVITSGIKIMDVTTMSLAAGVIGVHTPTMKGYGRTVFINIPTSGSLSRVTQNHFAQFLPDSGILCANNTTSTWSGDYTDYLVVGYLPQNSINTFPSYTHGRLIGCHYNTTNTIWKYGSIQASRSGDIMQVSAYVDLDDGWSVSKTEYGIWTGTQFVNWPYVDPFTWKELTTGGKINVASGYLVSGNILALCCRVIITDGTYTEVLTQQKPFCMEIY